MAEEKSPYDSYDDATNAANAADDADGAKHRKDGEADDGANETLESLKAAGSSAFGLAKEFTNRFREDRAAQSEVSDAADPTDGTESGKKGSFFDRATEFAKDVSGSVRRAAKKPVRPRPTQMPRRRPAVLSALSGRKHRTRSTP